MALRLSTASLTRLRLFGALLASTAATPLVAQQVADPDASLEALIPDAAVADPEGWAADGQSEPAADLPAVPEAPMADDLAVEWPDDIALPELVEIAPEPGADFADLDQPDQPVDARAGIAQVSPELVIAMPDDTAQFPVKAEFLAQFEDLSNIENLPGGSDNIAQLASRAKADAAVLDELLRAFGYYDAQVIRSVGARGPEDAPDTGGQVRFDIIPGARYRFGAIDLGELDRAPDAELLRDTFGLLPGDPLSSFRIVEEQADLDVALGEQGYPFAAIGEPSLLIDHARDEGDLSLPVTPGGKYVFGEVTSNRPQFLSGEHMARIARFGAGDIYQRSLEMDLRRAITATGLVSSVAVRKREVSPPYGDTPGVVALDVAVEPAKLRTVAGTVGYGSEEGFRLEASWEHRNLFPPEGALRVRGVAGTQEQLVGVTFRRNNFRGRDKVLTLDASAFTFDGEAVDAQTVALRASYERLSTLLYQKPLSWSLGAEVLATDERNRVVAGIPRSRRTYFIASLSGRVTLDATDSLLDPERGFRVSAFLSPEVSRAFDSEFTYLRAQLDASGYYPSGNKFVLAGRVRAATVTGAAMAGIAPSRRLYAGGGGSVRGYGYQAVGPRNDLGEPVGGRSLVEASAEARVDTGWFEDALQVVGFIDAAAVSTQSAPDFRFIKYGAGVGIRYKTAFGPIRVDVGVPLNGDEFDSPVAVYVSLGQAF